MPLYPTEKILWDKNQIPNVHYTGDNVFFQTQEKARRHQAVLKLIDFDNCNNFLECKAK